MKLSCKLIARDLLLIRGLEIILNRENFLITSCADHSRTLQFGRQTLPGYKHQQLQKPASAERFVIFHMVPVIQHDLIQAARQRNHCLVCHMAVLGQQKVITSLLPIWTGPLAAAAPERLAAHSVHLFAQLLFIRFRRADIRVLKMDIKIFAVSCPCPLVLPLRTQDQKISRNQMI